jgi:hypothetical protein
MRSAVPVVGKKPSCRRFGFGLTLTIAFAALLRIGADGHAEDTHVTDSVPGFTPGQVYKEYVLHNGGPKNWRVTDPNARHPGAHEFLPNPVLQLSVDDLDGAVRAEALLDRWSGHAGTADKRIRLNGGPWLHLPEPTTMPSGTDPERYLYQDNPVIDVPLEMLVRGTNTIEGTCGVLGNHPWGQWGLYSIVLRVYYDPSVKPHTSGRIASPAGQEALSDNPTVRVSAQSPEKVRRVDVLAYHSAYDVDGDGVYRDWVRAFHQQPSRGDAADLRHQVGTVSQEPYELTWDTRWVPDQEPGVVALVARIQSTDGVWFVTDRVEGLSLVREEHSIRMYPATEMPYDFTVRVGREKQCRIVIPENADLASADAAMLHLRTWHGLAKVHHPFKLNEWSHELKGVNHHYDYDVHSVPLGVLKIGANVFSVSSDTEHHGVEVLWPGPALVVRYRTAAGE